ACSFTLAVLLSGTDLLPLPFNEFRTAEALPTPSGALTPSPWNNNFNAGEQILGGPTNGGFELPMVQDPTPHVPNWPINGITSSVSTPSPGHSGTYYLQVQGGGCLCPQINSDSFTV